MLFIKWLICVEAAFPEGHSSDSDEGSKRREEQEQRDREAANREWILREEQAQEEFRLRKSILEKVERTKQEKKV